MRRTRSPISSPRTKGFNFWDRTVGTQYQKAQKNPLFGKVYNGIQDYLNDSSRLMNEASDLAPDLLPKMEGLADILKRGLSKDDVTNVSGAVFDGRLEDRVWSDDGARRARHERPSRSATTARRAPRSTARSPTRSRARP
jgi:hypothetical protein